MRNDSQTHQHYRNDFQTMKALGSPQIASNNQLVLDGFEDVRLLFQNFTHPIATGTDATEVALSGGMKMWVEGAPKTNFQSPVTLLETRDGAIMDLAERIMAAGPMDAWSYYGRKENSRRKFRWHGCILTFENGIEAAADGNSQVSIVQGTVSFHYFGQAANIGG